MHGDFSPWRTGQGALALPAIANAVPLLFVPGWNFLGASYGMSVVQAFYINTTCVSGGCSGAGFFRRWPNQFSGGGFVTANTTFNPITLSWNLGGGWFVSGAFNFMAPDGTRSSAALGSYAESRLLDPRAGVCGLVPVRYLEYNRQLLLRHQPRFEWQLLRWTVPGVSAPGLTETSGNLFYGDLHALYKMGKWSFGPVGAFEFQTTADTGSACQHGLAARAGRALVPATGLATPNSEAWSATISAQSISKSG
jgi:hypothetical protein